MNDSLHVAVSGTGKRVANAELAALHDQFVNGEATVAPQTTQPTQTVVRISDKMAMRDGVTKEPQAPKVEVDFSGKDFEETQKLLNQTAKVNSLNRDIKEAKKERMRVIGETFKPGAENNEEDKYPTSDDVIQYHLDKWETYESLERYLKGSLKDSKVATRINEFFTHPVTGEVLEMISNPRVKTDLHELDFKRGLILYFKRSDDYIAKIDKEVEKLNAAQAELDQGISEALNPLKDNILAYAEYLTANAKISEDDDADTIKRKRAELKKAQAIRNAYMLENLINLVTEKPGIIKNAVKDFRSELMIRQIGDRYRSKLRSADINFNLAPLLADDPHDSLEYKVLPQGDYPAGFENFTVFFIIRSLAVTLPAPEEVTFHAAVSVAFTQLINGTLNEDVADTMRRSITKFLSYFVQ